MTGQNKGICHYHKYGYCRMKDECDRYHSDKICRRTDCDVRNCSDRHPQACRFYASMEFCKFMDSCMYDHQKIDQNRSLVAKIDDITKKYDGLMKKTLEQDETIKFLLEQFQNLSRQTIGAVKEISEHIEAESREESDMQVERKDDSFEVQNNEECFEIYCDEQYKDIVRKQITIASNMDEKLKEIRKNLKSKKVEETLESLTMLDKSVLDEKKEMMKMVEKDVRYIEEYENENERQFNDSMTLSEIEEVREDPSDPNMKEMFEQFRVMLENIQKIPKNNFKRNAEMELTNMIKTTQWKKSDREAFLNCPTFTECCWEKLD